MQLEDDRTRDLANLQFHTAQVQDLTGSVLSRLDGKRRRLDARRVQGESERWRDWHEDEEKELRKIGMAGSATLSSNGTRPSDGYASAAGATVLVGMAAGGAMMKSFCDGGAVPGMGAHGSTTVGRGWRESRAVASMSMPPASRGVNAAVEADSLKGDSESDMLMDMLRSSTAAHPAAMNPSSTTTSRSHGASSAALPNINGPGGSSSTAASNGDEPSATDRPSIARTFRHHTEHHSGAAPAGTSRGDPRDDDEILREAGNRSAKEWAEWGLSHRSTDPGGQGHGAATGARSAHARGTAGEQQEWAMRQLPTVVLDASQASNATVPVSTLPSLIYQTLLEMCRRHRIHNLVLSPPEGDAGSGVRAGVGERADGARVFRLVQRQRSYGMRGELERHEVSVAVTCKLVHT